MSSMEKRVQQLEKEGPAGERPKFYGWIGNPWTRQEEEMMIRKYPHVKMFWKPLTPKLPREFDKMTNEEQALQKDLASLVHYDEEKEKRKDAAIRRKVNGESLSEEGIRLLKEIGLICQKT